jgi:peroxiredoxin
MLSRLQREHAGQGLRVVGISVDDPGRAQAFAQGLGLEYPVLFGAGPSGAGAAMLVGRRYGNASGMLPYSVLVDADGIVRWTHLGAVRREQLEAQLAALPQGWARLHKNFTFDAITLPSPPIRRRIVDKLCAIMQTF